METRMPSHQLGSTEMLSPRAGRASRGDYSLTEPGGLETHKPWGLVGEDEGPSGSQGLEALPAAPQFGGSRLARFLLP